MLLVDLAGHAPVPPGIEVIEDIAYREGHPLWTLDLYWTGAAGGRLRPAIVFIHGGGWRQGSKRGALYWNLALRYVAKGYVCASIDYRLTPEGAFPAPVIDAKCAVRWLRAHAGRYGIDPNRIGAFGNSSGGYLVSMLALAPPEAGFDEGPWRDRPSAIEAAGVVCAPSDFTVPAKPGDSVELDVLAAYLTGPAESLPQRRAAASPMSYVAPGAPLFLIIHGTADPYVPIDQADRLNDALKRVGADVTYVRVEGGGHPVYFERQGEVEPSTEACFDRVLLR